MPSTKTITNIANLMRAYPWVYAWEKMQGACSTYIEWQLQKAHEDRAPANATWRRDDGSWSTLDNVRSPSTLDRLGLHVRAKALALELAKEQEDREAKYLTDFLTFTETQGRNCGSRAERLARDRELAVQYLALLQTGRFVDGEFEVQYTVEDA